MNQREIIKLIENLSSKVDNLTNVNPGQNSLTFETGISEIPNDELEGVEPARSVNSNMVTGVINEPMTSNNTHARSSSLPPPNQRHSDEIIDKLLESLYATHKQTPNLPRLPKALATTMPTFDGKTEKFELFEDLFQTSLKVHPQITEQEKIHYFHSLLRGDALQTFRNMTETTKTNINDMNSWLYSPNDGTMSPISETSSSSYFSGSDWTTDSSWFSYDSLIQSVFQQPISSPFRPGSPLPPIPDAPQESRGLSRPQGCHGNHITRGTPEEGSEETNQVRSESP